jgi:hypothetical protein
MLCLTYVTCSGCSHEIFDVIQGTLDFDVSHKPEPVTFGNVVNAMWALPVDLGNELLDDPPEGVPDDVYACPPSDAIDHKVRLVVPIQVESGN